MSDQELLDQARDALRAAVIARLEPETAARK